MDTNKILTALAKFENLKITTDFLDKNFVKSTGFACFKSCYYAENGNQTILIKNYQDSNFTLDAVSLGAKVVTDYRVENVAELIAFMYVFYMHEAITNLKF